MNDYINYLPAVTFCCVSCDRGCWLPEPGLFVGLLKFWSNIGSATWDEGRVRGCEVGLGPMDRELCWVKGEDEVKLTGDCWGWWWCPWSWWPCSAWWWLPLFTLNGSKGLSLSNLTPLSPAPPAFVISCSISFSFNTWAAYKVLNIHKLV